MCFIKFRLFSILALTALVTGTFALPTRAKQPIQTQKIRPLLIAQSSANTSEPSLVVPDTVNTNTLDQFGTFLDTASPNATINIIIPVTDFQDHNGEVKSPPSLPLFNSFISDYGFLGITTGTAYAVSPQTPKFTQAQINNLKSVTVNFDYGYNQNPSTLTPSVLFIELYNVTKGTSQIITTLKATGTGTGAKVIPASVSIPTTDFLPQNNYEIIFVLQKNNADTAGFGNNNNISPVNVGDVVITLVQK